MDPVTHTLIGAGIGNAFFRSKIGRGTAPIMVTASLLPDVDALVHLTGDPAAILMRRTFGHSLVMLPIWSLALAFLLRRFYPHLSLRTLFGMAFLGSCAHVFFDLVNSFGIVPLWPLSDWRPELAIIFIIDLILTGLFLIPLLVCSPRNMRTYLVPVSRIAMAFVALYVIFCGANRIMAQQVLSEESERMGIKPDFTYVFPEPLGPHRWRGVVREGNIYRIFLIGSLTGRLEPKGESKSSMNDPWVRQARSTPLAHRLEWFFKAPVWKVEKNPESEPVEVTVRDLRFRSAVIERESTFVYRFSVYRDGRVEKRLD
jgi:inner membrane protein